MGYELIYGAGAAVLLAALISGRAAIPPANRPGEADG